MDNIPPQGQALDRGLNPDHDILERWHDLRGRLELLIQSRMRAFGEDNFDPLLAYLATFDILIKRAHGQPEVTQEMRKISERWDYSHDPKNRFAGHTFDPRFDKEESPLGEAINAYENCRYSSSAELLFVSTEEIEAYIADIPPADTQLEE